MNTILVYGLLLLTLGIFAYIGFQKGPEENEEHYLSARNSKNSLQIGLSLFASGMGIWVLFGPSEVGYWGGFWDVMGYAVSAATPFLLLVYVGPMIRKKMPTGVTLADYVRMRIGRPMQIYVGVISVLYMFTFLFAEFTAIGRAMNILTGINPLPPMLAIGLVTTAYTSYGGLPASLRTDRWQAWVVLWLFIALMLILFTGDLSSLITDAKAYNPVDEWSIGSMSYMDSFASGLALVIAITAAEMFTQGNWQRAYASEDDKALQKGSLLAAGLVFPVVLLMGILGTVVAGQGIIPAEASLSDKSGAFFYLLDDVHILFISAFIVLGLALVCSSVDTLQNAVVASISRDLSDGKMKLQHARVATVMLVPIAIYLATEPTIFGFEVNATSVFAIFLRADLLATATVLPVFLTLWNRISSQAALIGALSGLGSVVAYGIFTADLATGINYLWLPTNEYGLANLDVFLSALLGSGIVTVLVSVLQKPPIEKSKPGSSLIESAEE